MKPSVDISVTEWMDELASAEKSDDEGRTAEEMAMAAGFNVQRVRKMLHAALEQGRLKRGVRQFTRIDGRQASIPVYRILPAPAKCKET